MHPSGLRGNATPTLTRWGATVAAAVVALTARDRARPPRLRATGARGEALSLPRLSEAGPGRWPTQALGARLQPCVGRRLQRLVAVEHLAIGFARCALVADAALDLAHCLGLARLARLHMKLKLRGRAPIGRVHRGPTVGPLGYRGLHGVDPPHRWRAAEPTEAPRLARPAHESISFDRAHTVTRLRPRRHPAKARSAPSPKASSCSRWPRATGDA